MDNLELKIFRTGDLDVNAYVVFNKGNKDCFLVDCPKPINEYLDFIKENKLNLKFIIITHGHYDHIEGLNDLLKEFPVFFYIHKEDRNMLVNPMENGSLIMSKPVVINQEPKYLEDKQIINFGENKLEVIHTPGHSCGGISIKIKNWLFSGDTLFYHTVGRTDLPFSNKEQLKDSIKQKFFSLDKQIRVFPGHGRETTIGEEMTENPFI
ncbi:MAG: MBL fold metallo-hydrolase [Candidatus Pacebacteria bacterium]|nr:MBL fold metallo-hydrolase [Candidatus Paceibacterota bacterium]